MDKKIMTDKLTAYDKIMRSKIQLQLTKPFFSYLIMNLKIIETKKIGDMDISTMAVDIKGNLYYNSEWVEKLTEKNIEGVLVHEVLHIVLMHIIRTGGRDKDLFNCVNDLIVNDILVQEGFDLPEGLVPTSNHEYRIDELDYTVEKINEKLSEDIYEELYRLLKKNNNKGQKGMNDKRFDIHIYADENGDSNGDSKDGKGKKSKGIGNKLSDVEINKLEKIWKERLAEATLIARQRGILPLGMDRFIDGILEGKVNWRHKLYNITAELPFDWSYQRQSKKSIALGIYLPSTVKEKIDIVVSIDTSGSMGQEELTQFLSEVCYIARSFNNIEMDLLVCDAEIHQEYKINNNNINEIMGLKIGGGGGTSHKPIVDYINDKKPSAKLLIALTDGYSDIQTTFAELPNNCHRIIVLCTNSAKESEMEAYGEVIKM